MEGREKHRCCPYRGGRRSENWNIWIPISNLIFPIERWPVRGNDPRARRILEQTVSSIPISIVDQRRSAIYNIHTHEFIIYREISYTHRARWNDTWSLYYTKPFLYSLYTIYTCTFVLCMRFTDLLFFFSFHLLPLCNLTYRIFDILIITYFILNSYTHICTYINTDAHT